VTAHVHGIVFVPYCGVEEGMSVKVSELQFQCDEGDNKDRCHIIFEKRCQLKDQRFSATRWADDDELDVESQRQVNC